MIEHGHPAHFRSKRLTAVSAKEPGDPRVAFRYYQI
jgi:hypothetical protein